jgi:endonuclease IV
VNVNFGSGFDEWKDDFNVHRPWDLKFPPYLPNLCPPNRRVYEKSLNVLSKEVERCRLLSIPYLVLHLGSYQGKGQKSGVDQIVKSIESVLHKEGQQI